MISDARPRVSSTGNGGSGGLPPVTQKQTGESDDEQPGADLDPETILAKAGVEASNLPADLQDALLRGDLFSSTLRRWLWLSSVPVLGDFARAVPAFRDRILGNDRFLLVLGIELAMGVAAKATAEYQSRGENFWKEINFVISDLALEVVGDTAIVWLLSPKVNFSLKPVGRIGRWSNSLPGFALQMGDFPAGRRVATFVYRGLQFAVIGFGASVVGHSLTKAMVAQQEAANGVKAEKELAGVLDNSLGWGSFMLLSSNTRYQIVNTLEERLMDPFVHNTALKTALTFALRFGNTFIGGQQWVSYAQAIGIQ